MPTLADLWLARHLRDELGRVHLFVPLLTFYFFVVVLYSGLDYRFTYVLLMLVSLELIDHYGLTQLAKGKRQDALAAVEPPRFTPLTSILPLTFGIAVVFAPFFIYLFASGQGLTSQGLLGNGSLFLVEVLLVAPVEEVFFRWVMPQFYGGIVPAVLFALSHPAVRTILLADPQAALWPFVYYLLFGLLFQQLVFMGTASNVPEKVRDLLGLSFVIGVHGAFNTIAILFPQTVVAGFPITTFSVLPQVLVLGLLVGVLYAYRNISRPSMRRVRDLVEIRIRAQLRLIRIRLGG